MLKHFTNILFSRFYLRALLWISLIATLPLTDAYSQPIPVGDVQEEQYQLLQLLSDSTVDISMTQRPIWRSNYQKLLDQTTSYPNSWWTQPLDSYKKNIYKDWQLGLYEPVFTSTFNSDLPFGGNNGAAWYGRGFTEELQAGFYITSKYVTATFRPHLIYTQNKNFRTPRFIPRDGQGNPRYMAIFSGIDMPFRFGPDSYSDFNLGQTSLRLHYKNIEAGLSNETLWWGPGIQNALILSNNAPGMKHAFLGTRAPLKLPLGIGDLEFRFIWAKPNDSEYFETTEKTDRNRFTAGLNMSFSPGFAPNLSLGFIRFTHQYIPENGLTLSDYFGTLPIVNKRQNKNESVNDTGFSDDQNQIVSVYLRWAFPESNAEVYGEYLREDSFYNARDLFFEPDHDRGFTVGFQKLVEKNGWFDAFKINGEINSLVPGRVDEVRRQTYYYRHGKIRQGHTNGGEVLGAAIGPGSASQFLGVKGYFKQGNIGLFIQRVAQNDFFHYQYYDEFGLDPQNGKIASDLKDIYRHRINLNLGLTGRYKTGPLLLSGQLVWNKNYNYGRYNYGELEGINFDTVEKHDVINIQLQLSARYYFRNF